MLVEDIRPNRLERAKQEILDLLQTLQGDRVGLVAFSGAAFIQCPLTEDYDALEMFLGALRPDLFPIPGTDLGEAFETALSSFDFESETDKIILLITDGEDNEKKGLETARTAAQKGVKIFILGIGETLGGPIPAANGKGGFRKDKEGKLILSKLQEEGLKKIASITGGSYVRSMPGDLGLDTLYLDGIKPKIKTVTLKGDKIKAYGERFPFFVLVAVLLLLLEGMMDGGGRRKAEGRREKYTLISNAKFSILPLTLVLIGLIFSAQASGEQSPDELYRQGRFGEAEKAYARSNTNHPNDIRYPYNRGCAAYQNADYHGAMAAFSSVLRQAKGGEIRYKAAYNLGNAAYKLGDFKTAVAYYRQSILYNPADENARYNMELALRKLDKQKKDKIEGPTIQPKKDIGQPEEKEDGLKTSKGGQSPDEQLPQEKSFEQRSSQVQDQWRHKDQIGSTQEEEFKRQKGARPDEAQKAGQKFSGDLPGELKLLHGSPGEQGDVQTFGPAMSKMDKTKAEALLDNVKESRSRFLRFQVPKYKKHGVQSGKNW
jgi:Ca-activated chloride channel family protein